MKITLSVSQTADMLMNDPNANWGYSGAEALAEHLHQIEDETGEEMELDVVAIRCDFARYDNLSEWAESYGLGFDNRDDDNEAKENKICAFIRNHGTLIEFNGGIIVSQF
jgi:hypothetical protein